MSAETKLESPTVSPSGLPPVPLFVLDELSPGETIQRGDLMLVIPGDPKSLAAMDNGKIMGMRTAGCQVKKAGAWYRPRWTNDPAETRRP